ncbi:mycofactocin precursor MftA [Euzebya tangerina]|uniref:mycofactocin precursor MftA n=1 Tax=Euzebya tangerina TaxID=591198 RepID=UPI000E3121A3|nr:mycofactocin precursor MftA [Euzebya tangerina]
MDRTTDRPGTTPTPTPTADAPVTPQSRVTVEQSTTLVLEELLVEEVSIDGMCGVY